MMLQHNQIVFLILSLLGHSIMTIWACSVLKLTTPEELISKAHAIVRAKAISYEKPPAEQGSWYNGTPDSVITFELEEQIKGNQRIPNPLWINGYLSEHDDFNDRPSPYDFVRPNGRSGSCIANTYKQNAEFLLFLDDKFTPYWDALTPVNEQLHSPSSDDQWLQWTHEEFLRTVVRGFKKSLPTEESNSFDRHTFLPSSHVAIPSAVDWRKKGAVTTVIEDQGQCGSCWAFTATGALEGQHFLKTGNLVRLSAQNLIDCTSKYGNEGCCGGYMDASFQYIKDNKGLDTEASYPYEAQDGKCRFKRATVGATDTGFVDLPSGNETTLQSAIATVGPIAVAIDAMQESFQFYSSGVYDDPKCSSTDVNHTFIVIGYDTLKNGTKKQDYYIAKNSWGETWGNKGYIWMSRNKNNQCGIANIASYPLV
ncbi:unnamed protein product [Rotaria sp. Silwood2]|nr:unnamed protein product [Rotaria sp. Silwood2]